MNPPPCPFCNAPLPPLAAPPTADKLPCPRCGEAVAAARWTVDPLAHNVRENPASPAPYATKAKAEAAPRNRKTALVLIGVMLTMAIVSLSYILWTVDVRRARDPHITKKLEPIGQRRPLELAGLGYLPRNVHFVAGLHVAEMMADKNAGRPLLEEPRPAYADWVFKQITRATGLGVEDLDHVVVAVTLDASPQLVMVVKSLAGYDLGKSPIGTGREKPLYKGQALYEYPRIRSAKLLLWCVDERTLVCVFPPGTADDAHLDALSQEPRPVQDVLPGPIHDVLKERLHTSIPVGSRPRRSAWLAQGVPAEESGALKEMKTFAVGIEPTEGLTMTGNFFDGRREGGASFKGHLENVKIDGAKSQKAEATDADASDQWVTWQVRRRGHVSRVLNRGKDKKKGPG